MIPTDVHPEIQAFLRQVAEAGLPSIQELTPEAAREQFEAGMRARLAVFPAPPVASVENRTIPGPAGAIPVRVYRDSDPGNGRGPAGARLVPRRRARHRQPRHP